MSRTTLALTAAGIVTIGGVLLWSGRASASTSAPDLPSNLDLTPLPAPSDVSGDLLTNWGDTPSDLRPLFVAMEEASQIPGSARIFAVIASRESKFQVDAHNGDGAHEQAERDASRRAYENHKANNPPLRYGEQAADFGSGGLFGALAPYFLWTGVPAREAHLLNAPPELMFQPRAAAFAACVYLQRLLAHYRVDDHADIKAGWASPSLLVGGRGQKTYNDVRARFLADASTLGVDLAAIPHKRLDHAAWPGVTAVFQRLIGKLPQEIV
ncbi:MAG: hypothetical protein IPK80_21040 [Nannocystis sp.]|nr:hypothetical protein [Nannocystis sp.]